ncbi:DUF2254 domain-containing protein [Streptomyces sp. NPDC089919]|uniref:DUF2254 domain-containing protein n=1 Tax=Streptomyces sp. NPDC089919 TaxID=3155188 RepID=UPI0034461346
MSGLFGLGMPRGVRRLWRVREHVRDTLWFAPVAGLVLTFALWNLATWGDQALVDALTEAGAEVTDLAEDAKAIVTTVSQAMLTFLGVVFSISLVALQMTSAQLTPRVVRIFVRSRITKATLTVFLSTFVFALLVLTSYNDTDPAGEGGAVPLLQALCTLALVALSLLLFIAYVTATVRLMQVGPVVDRITREALRGVERQPTDRDLPAGLPEQTGVLRHRGRAGVLCGWDTADLVGFARRHGVTLRTVPRVGDYVMPGSAVLAVHGGRLPATAVLPRAVAWVGSERIPGQDAGFGLRQLSDIALRALSSAVNDPTTAVQCLDRIVHLLAATAARPLGPVPHHDRDGALRLLQAAPDWTELVDLALAEIRAAAPGQAQVTRRFLAGVDDLLALVPEDRAQALLHHRALLERAVHHAVPDPAERDFALEPDRQGIT